MWLAVRAGAEQGRVGCPALLAHRQEGPVAGGRAAGDGPQALVHLRLGMVRAQGLIIGAVHVFCAAAGQGEPGRRRLTNMSGDVSPRKKGLTSTCRSANAHTRGGGRAPLCLRNPTCPLAHRQSPSSCTAQNRRCLRGGRVCPSDPTPGHGPARTLSQKLASSSDALMALTLGYLHEGMGPNAAASSPGAHAHPATPQRAATTHTPKPLLRVARRRSAQTLGPAARCGTAVASRKRCTCGPKAGRRVRAGCEDRTARCAARRRQANTSVAPW